MGAKRNQARYAPTAPTTGQYQIIQSSRTSDNNTGTGLPMLQWLSMQGATNPNTGRPFAVGDIIQSIPQYSNAEGRLKRKAELMAGANTTTCADPNYGKGFPMVKARCKQINKLVNSGAVGGANYSADYTDPVTGQVWPSAQDPSTGAIDPTQQAAITASEQPVAQTTGGDMVSGSKISFTGTTRSGKPFTTAWDASYFQPVGGFSMAEGGSVGGGVTHIAMKTMPVVGLAAGLAIAFLINKKKDFGTKGLIGGAIIGTVLGVLVPVLMHKPHVKVAPAATGAAGTTSNDSGNFYNAAGKKIGNGCATRPGDWDCNNRIAKSPNQKLTKF